MKVRWSIAGAVLFALTLALSALPASARPVRAASCHVVKPQFRSINGRFRYSRYQLVGHVPRHHAPAPRLHRIRGKRINIQGSTAPDLQRYAETRILVPGASSGTQTMEGPNPSRGPPSQVSLIASR